MSFFWNYQPTRPPTTFELFIMLGGMLLIIASIVIWYYFTESEIYTTKRNILCFCFVLSIIVNIIYMGWAILQFPTEVEQNTITQQSTTTSNTIQDTKQQE